MLIWFDFVHNFLSYFVHAYRQRDSDRRQASHNLADVFSEVRRKRQTLPADGVLDPVVSDEVGLARCTHHDVLQIAPRQTWTVQNTQKHTRTSNIELKRLMEQAGNWVTFYFCPIGNCKLVEHLFVLTAASRTQK